jgi:3-methylcrotonyl-CoA carboxylase alpha subunit
MIRRLLIANRGEIALRIIRACREMNIETIAVFSDVDARAPHVLAADHAAAIGPAPATESYLSIPALIGAARTHRADAVHPGYGFLSESAAFARACEQTGLIYVGPPSDVISRMGSKIEARQLVQSAGVPIVPGKVASDQSDSGILRALEDVGFPALVKASAGGGGKAMREVGRLAEATEAIRAARREAVAAFGDDTLYVERLIDRPRHVEVQIFADAFGHTTHLFERECSAQRRHQKVLEESPAPALTPALRERMTQAAVAAARAASYRNAGTVEFLVEGRGDAAKFYFLEMNTRLQVEHPVTEAVAGVDLVRAQFLVASGEPVPWPEGSLAQRGHAIEARVYAEDPSREFLPQAGRLLLYREPRLPGVRIDAGVAEGNEVTVHYDPMLAKVIAVGETRDAAIGRLAAALREYPVLGVRTNIPYLLKVLDHPRFRAGDIDTGFLDRDARDLVQSVSEPPAFLLEALRQLGDEAGDRQAKIDEAGADPWLTLRDWRV